MTATSPRPRVHPRRLLRGALAAVAALALIVPTAALADEHDLADEILPPPPPPSVTVIVPVTLTPRDGTLLTASELEEATSEDGALTSILNAVEFSDAVIAVDPSITAAIRVLGTAAPDSARTWLSRLENMSNERFTLQFGDADLTAQAQAGLTEPLAAPALSSYLNADNFESSTSQPSVEELSRIRGEIPNVIWPRDAARAEDLAVFADYFGENTLTLLPGGSAHARVGEHSVVLYDEDASEVWGRAIAQTNADIRSSLFALGTAKLPDTGRLVIALPRNDELNGANLREALVELAQHTTSSTLSELRALPQQAITLESEIDTARADAVIALMSDENALATFSSILEVPAALTDYTRMRLLRTLSVDKTDAAFADAVDASHRRAQATLDGVRIETSSDVQILSATVDLPVWIRNDLQWPVLVTLIAQSGDARLDVQRATQVTLMPESSERARVPVEARVASGDVDVSLRLVSAEGITIGEPTKTHVKVRAEWERIGISVLVGLVVLLFVAGVIRTVRRKRREGNKTENEDADE